MHTLVIKTISIMKLNVVSGESNAKMLKTVVLGLL